MEPDPQTSGFLDKMPKEIRLQIYKHVIGNRLVHLTNSSANGSKGRAVCTVCTALQHYEHEAYDLTRTWTPAACEPVSLPECVHVYYSANNMTWLKEYWVRPSSCSISSVRFERSATRLLSTKPIKDTPSRKRCPSLICPSISKDAECICVRAFHSTSLGMEIRASIAKTLRYDMARHLRSHFDDYIRVPSWRRVTYSLFVGGFMTKRDSSHSRVITLCCMSTTDMSSAPYSKPTTKAPSSHGSSTQSSM